MVADTEAEMRVDQDNSSRYMEERRDGGDNKIDVGLWGCRRIRMSGDMPYDKEGGSRDSGGQDKAQ